MKRDSSGAEKSVEHIVAEFDSLRTERILVSPHGDVGYEALSTVEVARRIKQLAHVRKDIEAALEVIRALEVDAEMKSESRLRVKQQLLDLLTDKASAESLLRLPADSLGRVLYEASSRNRLRGILEGTMIGFMTGIISSWVVWYFTK